MQDKTGFRNTHYSGIMSLSKIFIHEFLPDHIRDYILIDSDMVFVGNIGRMMHLGRYALMRRANAVVAMGCSKDSMRIHAYCGERIHNCHPTHYCISAPLYANRTKMLMINWTNIIETAMTNMTSNYPGVAYGTADQDIYNRIMWEFPITMAALPCRWRCDFSTYGKYKSMNSLPRDDVCHQEKCLVIHYNQGSSLQKSNFYYGFWKEYSEMTPAMVNDPNLCPHDNG